MSIVQRLIATDDIGPQASLLSLYFSFDKRNMLTGSTVLLLLMAASMLTALHRLDTKLASLGSSVRSETLCGWHSQRTEIHGVHPSCEREPDMT